MFNKITIQQTRFDVQFTRCWSKRVERRVVQKSQTNLHSTITFH